MSCAMASWCTPRMTIMPSRGRPTVRSVVPRRDEAADRVLEEPQSLGDRQQAVRPGHRVLVVVEAAVRRGDRAHQGDARRRLLQIGELRPRLRRDRAGARAGSDSSLRWVLARWAIAMAIASRSPVRRRSVTASSAWRSTTRASRPIRAEATALVWSAALSAGSIGDLERLLEERQRLLVRAERGRPLRSCPECDPGLRSQRIGLRLVRGQSLGRKVVTREPAGELVRAQILEVARRREMADLAVPAREDVVGDLADQPLDEGVLAALG